MLILIKANNKNSLAPEKNGGEPLFETKLKKLRMSTALPRHTIPQSNQSVDNSKVSLYENISANKWRREEFEHHHLQPLKS